MNRLASIFLVSILGSLALACPSKNVQKPVPNDGLAENVLLTSAKKDDMAVVIEAHGGFATWQSFHMLSYDLLRDGNSENHLIDLRNRKVLITHRSWKLGFDGTDVWIVPDKAAYGEGSPIFYYNLYFYFFAIPHIFEDPGITRTYQGKKTVNGKIYDVFSISFDEGVGNSSKDSYILHIDPQTNLLDFLLYTATYFSGKSTDKYGCLVYKDWENINGLRVPQRLVWRKWEGGNFGEMRAEVAFTNIKFSRNIPDASAFARPAGAYIAPKTQ